MISNFIILFASALIPGGVAFFLNNVEEGKYKLTLVFAGAYLFSITIIHILPELFSNATNPTQIGLFVLLGFFIQQFLEYFSAGAEHGHIHIHDSDHKHSPRAAIMVLVAMIVHAFLEGGLLAHPSTIHAHHDSKGLLFGIVLHKAPAAFALMTILLCHLKNKKLVALCLVIFSLASPLGMSIGDYFVENNALSDHMFSILFGVVSGSFLHISTTIVFESSANHRFNARKMGVAVAGALIAVLFDTLM